MFSPEAMGAAFLGTVLAVAGFDLAVAFIWRTVRMGSGESGD